MYLLVSHTALYLQALADENVLPLPGVVHTNKKDFPWRAHLWVGRRKKNLGSYRTEEEAARAYDEGARQYHTERTVLNFPPQQPPLHGHDGMGEGVVDTSKALPSSGVTGLPTKQRRTGNHFRNVNPRSSEARKYMSHYNYDNCKLITKVT